MAKSADAFRTISEVADWLETPAHVLRFWESKFTQVKPVKRAGGRRYYRPGDMELLGGIKQLLHEEGMTIKGVQKLLRERGVGHVAGLSSKRVSLEDEGEAPMAEGVEAEEATIVPFRAPPAQPAPAAPVAEDTPPAPEVEEAPPAATAEPEESEPDDWTAAPAPGPAPETFGDAPAPFEETAFGPTDMEAGADHEGVSEDVAKLVHAFEEDSQAPAPQTAPRPLSIDVGPDPADDALAAPAGVLAALSARKAPLSPEDARRIAPLLQSLAAWARKGTPG